MSLKMMTTKHGKYNSCKDHGPLTMDHGCTWFLKSIVYSLWSIVFLSVASLSFANNLSISNVSLEDRDPGADTVVVEFDISWDHAWRNDINHDAAWVFIKACEDDCTSAGWEHADLLKAGVNPQGTSPGTEQDPQIEVYVPTDKVGAFIRPNATHTGTISAQNVRLTVDYSSFGAADTDLIQLKVFGIEMAYIPDGDFYIGDGDGTNESTNAFHAGTGNTAQQVTSSLLSDVRVDVNGDDDAQIEATGIGIDGDGGLDVDDDADIDDSDNALFPTGWKSFYMMKYQLSQAQYRDFLNTLSRAQQTTRMVEIGTAGDYVMTDAASVTTRDTIRLPNSLAGSPNPEQVGCDLDGDGVFNEYNDGEWIAMNYISWMDLAAYADWAGLRPMTELEFEKAARGPLDAVYSEYAWGTSTDLTQAEGPIQNSGQSTETASTTGQGLVNYNGSGTDISGPLRVGFAASSSTNRVSAGAGYYGNMNLSGNVTERAVTVGNSAGRSFEGSHGDGALTTTSSYEGNATNTDWPGIDGTAARGVTGASGSGYRSASWYDSATYSMISDRSTAANTDTAGTYIDGGRLVRTADLRATVMYVSTDTANDGDLSAYGSDGRTGADAFCNQNKPSNLPEECANIRALISVSSTDEIQDMPIRYGYHSELPIYWWHNTNLVFNQAADNWTDLLDGSIAMTADAGTGISSGDSVWTGSDGSGGLAAEHCINWTSPDVGDTGIVGVTNSTSAWDDDSSSTCDYSGSLLYCVCQYEVP